MSVCRFLTEMRDRGASFTERISKLTFAIQASCLAKERCIPEIDNSEYTYIIYICMCVCVCVCVYTHVNLEEFFFLTKRRIVLNYTLM